MTGTVAPTDTIAKQSVWIVRYGLTKYPLVENKGPYDSALDSTTGMEHAKSISKRISESGIHVPKFVYTSPFVRTAHTGQLIALELPSPSVRIEEGLTEWLTPSLLVDENGVRTFPKSIEELASVYGTIDLSYKSVNPGAPDDVVDPPKGAPKFVETEEALIERCATTFTKLLEVSNGENFVIVSHAPCDQAIALHLEGKGVKDSKLGPWPLGGLTLFSRSKNSDGSFGEWEMEFYGDTNHMPGAYQSGLKEWSLPCLAKAPAKASNGS